MKLIKQLAKNFFKKQIFHVDKNGTVSLEDATLSIKARGLLEGRHVFAQLSTWTLRRCCPCVECILSVRE